MLIQDMTEADMRYFIREHKIGRLAYIKDGAPYITPMRWTFNAGALYSFTTEGQKTDAMRLQPNIAILFDRVSSGTDWQSVLVHGIFREIADAAGRAGVAELMNKAPEWWEPAYVRTMQDHAHERKLDPVYFRVDITAMTGHQTA